MLAYSRATHSQRSTAPTSPSRPADDAHPRLEDHPPSSTPSWARWSQQPSAELPCRAAFSAHTFVVVTLDRIITLWERPRRSFKAPDHSREPA